MLERVSEVGQLLTYDIDAQRAYVRELDAKLQPAVAKCFKPDSNEMAEWAELHGRVDEYLSTWTVFGVMTPMLFAAGKVITQQLQAWVPRVEAAGCPIDKPAGDPPKEQPGPLKEAASVIPTSLEQGVVLLFLLWLASEKIKKGLGI